MITFDAEYFGKLVNSNVIRKTRLQEYLGMSNTATINRWAEGGDIYAGKLAEICNHAQRPITDFFLVDGVRLTDRLKGEGLHKEETTLAAGLGAEENEMQAALQADKMQLLLKHTQEMADLRIELTEQMYRRIDEERERLENKYDQKLEAKDEEINRLREALNEAQQLNKEMELRLGGYWADATQPTAVAENVKTPSPYRKGAPGENR